MRLEPVFKLQGRDPAPTVLVLPDDRVLALGGGGLEVWDGGSGAHLLSLRGFIAGDVEEDEEEFPGQALPHGTGHLVAAGLTAISWGGMPHVTAWPLDGGPLHRVFHGGDVSDALLLPDGRRAVSACASEDELWVWNVRSGAILQRLTHAADIPDHHCAGHLALHPDGRRLVSGAHEGLCLWDLETSKHQRTLFDSSVNALWFRSDGRLFAAAGPYGGTIAAFDVDLGRCRSMVALDDTTKEPIQALIGEPQVGLSRQVRGWRAAGPATPPEDPDDASLLYLDRSAYEIRTPDGGALHGVERGQRDIDVRRFGACLPLPDQRHILLESHWQAAPQLLLIANVRGEIVSDLLLSERLAIHAVGRSGRLVCSAGSTLHVFQVVNDPA